MKNKEVKIKYLSGIVISIAGQKSARVRVERIVMNKKLKKSYRMHKNYYVVNEKPGLTIGDQVMIYPGKKVSKNKSWYIL